MGGSVGKGDVRVGEESEVREEGVELYRVYLVFILLREWSFDHDTHTCVRAVANA